MVVFHTVTDLHKQISLLKSTKSGVGFVPTMGALHKGHISLVKESLKENDITIVSVFVNPTQFNDQKDFDKYPRDINKDALLLDEVGVNIVFAPTVDEIYPTPDTRQFDFGQLDKVMEGEHRPGHFNGVAQVVSRLFEIVKPDRAYFGEKDFQQLAIIRSLVKKLELPLQIVGMPIVREASGLALSSRNERLTEEQKKDAVEISAVLTESKNWIKEFKIQDFIQKVSEKINQTNSLHVEYFDIVDGNNLQSISEWSDSDYVVGCIAVFCGEIRLIDNITYLKP